MIIAKLETIKRKKREASPLNQPLSFFCSPSPANWLNDVCQAPLIGLAGHFVQIDFEFVSTRRAMPVPLEINLTIGLT
jgi:hypothetical protein